MVLTINSESDEDIYIASEQTENPVLDNDISSGILSTISGESCEVKLTKVNGIYKIPVTINSTIRISFIFDSGAADVLITPDVASVLIKSGSLTKDDYLGSAKYIIADGSIIEQAQFRLASIQIGTKIIRNVCCSVSNNLEAPMLLGQTVMENFGKYTFDYQKQILIIE